LFVDRDGVLVLVEVKRSSDTRIRREAVGQMLDYAANAVRYWPVDVLRASYAQAHAESGVHWRRYGPAWTSRSSGPGSAPTWRQVGSG
jgi:hypothetical protein